MKFKGYKIKVRCINWEQINTIDKFWNYVSKYIEKDKIIGLGMNWTNNFLSFEYALGVINDENTLQKLKHLSFEKEWNAEYIEIQLPPKNEWKTFTGKDKDVKEIYEKQIDCYKNTYDYELEYIDKIGNIKIPVHFLEKKK